MGYLILFGPWVFLQKLGSTPTVEGNNAVLWITSIVIGVAIATITGVWITHILKKFYELNDDRYKRIEHNIEKICKTQDDIIKGQNEFHTHVHLQKDKNLYYAEGIQENKRKLDEVLNNMNKLVFDLLKKK